MTDNMNQKQQEKIQEKKNLEKFNSITQKVKPETRTRPTMYERSGRPENEAGISVLSGCYNCRR